MNLLGLQPYQKASVAPLTKAERAAHFDRVASLGCIINNKDCDGGLNLHHPTGAGWGLKADDKDVIPLCFNHHSAQTPLAYGHSIHKGTRVFEKRYGSQRELLQLVRDLLA